MRMLDGARRIVFAVDDGDRHVRERAEHGTQVGRLLAADRFDHGTLVQLLRIRAHRIQQRALRPAMKTARDEGILGLTPLCADTLDELVRAL